MLKMILKDLRLSPLRSILTSVSMLVGIIAMIGSVLVGTLGREYLISVNAQVYGWSPTYSFVITESDFHDRNKMEQLFQRFEAIDDVAAVTFSMGEDIRFAPMKDLTPIPPNDVYQNLMAYNTNPERAAKALAELEKAFDMPYMGTDRCDDATRKYLRDNIDKAKLGDPSGFAECIQANYAD